MFSVLQGTVSEIFGQILLTILTIVLGALYFRIARRNFNKYFGLDNDRGIEIYLSNLWDPQIDKEPWGEIVAWKEIEAADILTNIFTPTSPAYPKFVRRALDWILFGKKVDINLRVSPQRYSTEIPCNMIILGSSTKNSVRRHFFSNPDCKVLVHFEGETIDPPANIHEKPLRPKLWIQRKNTKESWGLEDGFRLAIIERGVITNGNDSRVVFFCLGTTAEETKFAANYLVSHWRELEKAGKNKNHYAICHRFGEEGVRTTTQEFHNFE